MLEDFSLTFRALRQTGLLGPNPVWAVLQLLWCLLRYGASLYTLVAWNALRNPSSLVLVEAEKSLTYQALQARSEQLAAAIRQQFPEARTVGILCRNSIAYVEILLACGRLGLEVVLLNTNFSSEQLAALLEKKPLELVFCDEDLRERIRTSASLQVLSIRDLPSSPSGVQAHPTGFGLFKRLSKITVLTSGTTGSAKIVRRKVGLEEALGTARGLLEGLRPKAGESVLLTIPLLHGHGLTTLAFSLAMGSPLYLFPKASAEDFLACIEANKINVVVLVPTILYRLVEASRNPHLSSVRAIVCGSAPLDAGLAQKSLQLFGPVLYNLYGSSEAGIISLAKPEDLIQAPQTVGRPLPKVDLKILKDSNDVGCILARGVDTGDIGYLDNTGRLFLLGRTDDLIICGGVNVYPQTIEQSIYQNLEYIQECAAIGILDAEYGQAIHLFVVLRNEVGEEKIRQDLEAIFPRTLRPKKISLIESLPRNLAGKIQRFKLQEMV